MDLTYDRSTILNGNRIRRQAEERPPTFAEYNGATDAVPASNLDVKYTNRMAGPAGLRALELMNNPEAMQATNDWMGMFSQSNQGMEFNEARMVQSGAVQPKEEKK